MAAMLEYSCWFCGHGIERTDQGAVMISVEGLWRWEAGAKRDDPLQAIYAHSNCAKDRMQGASMDLEPAIFGEED